MKDHFDGNKSITLQPGDSAVPYTFTYSACSSATANDGSIPFGTEISSVAVKAYNDAGTDVTAQMINASSETDNVVSVALNYPSTTGDGCYHIEIILTPDSGAKMEADFVRVYAGDAAA